MRSTKVRSCVPCAVLALWLVLRGCVLRGSHWPHPRLQSNSRPRSLKWGVVAGMTSPLVGNAPLNAVAFGAVRGVLQCLCDYPVTSCMDSS